jgi:broad specificity phosphatase PhoE
MKRCYLVRHGQTQWNSDNRLQGHADQPLNTLGFEQARKLGAFFAHRPVAGIWTSRLIRSQQTARGIVEGNGHRVAPVVEADLAEMNLGSWEGLTPDDINAKFNGIYDRWRVAPSTVVIPGAEGLAEFRARVRGVFARLTAAWADGEYVVVSHGGVIAALLSDVLDADYDALLRRLRLDNGGVTAFDFSGAHPHVLWINGTAHLYDGADVPAHGWY